MMKLFFYLLFVVFITKSTAQVVSYMPRNGIPSNVGPSQPQNFIGNINNMRAVPNGGIVRNIPNVVTNGQSNNGGQILTNLLPNGITNAANNNAINAQIARAQIANAVNENAALATQEIAAINNANNDLATLAGNLANINGNIATFNLGNAFTVTSGSPGNQGFGIQLLADALEVGGKVAVNGQIPIFGTVAVNGNVPTDGSASVNYSCGRPACNAASA